MKVDAARGRDRRVELAHRARAEIARVLILGIGIRQFAVNPVKVRIAHQRLAAEQELSLIGNAERHIAERAHIVGHEFADVAVAACHRLIEFAVPVAEHNREAVHLPGEQGLLIPEPGNQLIHTLGLVEREHRLFVRDFRERRDHLIADALGRRAGEHNAALLFELLQAVVGAVVLKVTHELAALLVIGARRGEQAID